MSVSQSKTTKDFFKEQSKTTKDFFKELDKFYKKDNGSKFREWLDTLKIYNIGADGKIPNLLNNSKIQVNTEQPTSKYNLILRWILDNKDKFTDYDFTGIPESNHIDIEEEIKNNIKIPKKQFKTVEDVERWCENFTVHPVTDKEMNPMSAEYDNIFRTAFKILKKKYDNDFTILGKLPKEHLLFKKYDFIYYDITGKSNLRNPNITTVPISDSPVVFDMLTKNIQNMQDKDTALDTELEFLKNRFTGENFYYISNEYSFYIYDMVSRLLNDTFEYKKSKMNFVTGSFSHNGLKALINFIENESFSNDRNILVYLRNLSSSSSSLKWVKELLNTYYTYKKCYNDIKDLIEPDLSVSNPIVDNYENKQFKMIVDPLEQYFKPYTDKLAALTKPKYLKLINLETYEPTNNYLNDKQYEEFSKEYDKKLEKYNQNVEKYKTELEKRSPGKSSPTPPKKFSIKLSNGIYYYPAVKPLHIPDKVVEEFNETYTKLKPSILEYKKIKDMSYDKLVKSSSSSSGSNSLFKMSRTQIQDNLLYDPSKSLKDRCNDDKDILTQEEFADENYPLAKLQLMVRLKVKFDGKSSSRYKTECIYAPSLYNHLVSCVNSKKPFINPITRVKYTDKHIEQLMKVMRVIDKDIEVPRLLKPINDTKLKIEISLLPDDNSFISDMRREYGGILNFYSVDIYRKFGDKEYKIYHLCTIPANIGNDSDDLIKTGSNDIASSVMITHIYKLFYDGSLLCNYIPPYFKLINDYKQFVELGIHFNRYKNTKDWIYDLGIKIKTKQEVLDMFTHYLSEINNFIYH